MTITCRLAAGGIGAPVETLLSRLDGVTQRAPGRWLARCPGPVHRRGDRNRSLSVGETSDGTVLLHCFAGCNPSEILGAVGLELRDLFPSREGDGYAIRPTAPRIPWRDVFEALETDLTACSLAFSDLAAGKQFSPDDATYITERAADLAEKFREVRHVR